MATQVEQIVSWAVAQKGKSHVNGRQVAHYCQRFVAMAYQQAGLPYGTAGSATQAGNMWIVSRSRDNIPVGAAVYFTSPTDRVNGHVGIYIGNGQVCHTFPNVTIMSLTAIINRRYGYRGWGWHGGKVPSGAGTSVSLDSLSSSAVASTEATRQAVEVIHTPQTEKVYTKYEADVYTKQPDEYRVTWQSVDTGLIRDITDRCEVPEMTDDADSLCLELSVTVRQGGADYYMPPLILVPGDHVAVTNVASEEVVFLGQVQTVEGSYQSALRCRCLDGGRALTANEVIIQYNNISAKDALSQLANRLEIPNIVCPDLISSVYGIYRDSAAAIARQILETVQSENGVRYFLRMVGTTLTIRSFGNEPIELWCRQAANLDSFDVFNEAAEPQLGWSIEDLRNKITIYSGDDAGTSIQAELEDAESIKRYGRRETVESFSSQGSVSASNRAKTLLWQKNRVNETFTLECYGSDRAVAGALVHISLAEVQGYFWITAVRHTYGTPHRMTLTLQRSDYEPPTLSDDMGEALLAEEANR